MTDSSSTADDTYQFDSEHILSLGHYSCVLLPFEVAKRVLSSFHDHMGNAEKLGGYQVLAFAEAQKRILGKMTPDVTKMITQMKSEKAKKGLSSVADTRWAIELDRQQQLKEIPLRIASLQRRRQRSVPCTKPDKSVVETIKKAIESTISNGVDGLDVSIQGDNVTLPLNRSHPDFEMFS